MNFTVKMELLLSNSELSIDTVGRILLFFWPIMKRTSKLEWLVANNKITLFTIENMYLSFFKMPILFFIYFVKNSKYPKI